MILKELGRGGMGVVYQAKDPALDRLVAIKTMPPSLAADPELLQRFYREGQSAGNLRHPNIVTIHDLGEDQGTPYMVMEFLEGWDLEAIIRNRVPFNLIRKLRVITQVCRGLDFAHRRGIIHRDVKPANIRVLPNDEAKIVDFGIAHIPGSTITQANLLVGTVNYMSPEHVQASQNIEGRSDLFSVGVMLYEFLTYERPFLGDTITATLFNIVHQPIKPAHQCPASCPPELYQIIEKALAKRPEERFETGEKMAQSLEAVSDNLRPKVISELLEQSRDHSWKQDYAAAYDLCQEVLSLESAQAEASAMAQRLEREYGAILDERERQRIKLNVQRQLCFFQHEKAVATLNLRLQRHPEDVEFRNLLAEVSQGLNRMTDLLLHEKQDTEIRPPSGEDGRKEPLDRIEVQQQEIPKKRTDPPVLQAPSAPTADSGVPIPKAGRDIEGRPAPLAAAWLRQRKGITQWVIPISIIVMLSLLVYRYFPGPTGDPLSSQPASKENKVLKSPSSTEGNLEPFASSSGKPAPIPPSNPKPHDPATPTSPPKSLDSSVPRVVLGTGVLLLKTGLGDVQVKIDEHLRGVTDRTGNLSLTQLPTGNHRLQMIRDGYQTVERVFSIGAGEQLTLDLGVDLMASGSAFSKLILSSSPAECEVYIDEKPAGRTSANGELQLQVESGPHKIVLKKERFRSREQLVDFQAGLSRPMAVHLDRMVGSLEIQTRLEGVLINVNGQTIDPQGKKTVDLEPGAYEVQASKSGYVPGKYTIEILDAQTTPLVVSLDPLPLVSSAPPPLPFTRFRDDFVTLNQWDHPSSWSATDGLLRARGVGIALVKDLICRDFTLQFKLRLSNNTAMYLLLRAQDRNNFYLVQLAGRSYAEKNLRNTVDISAWKDGARWRGAEFPLPVSLDARRWMDVIVEVRGGAIHVKAGGEWLSGTKDLEKELGNFKDGAGLYPTGRLGYMVRAGEEYEITSFDLRPLP